MLPVPQETLGSCRVVRNERTIMDMKNRKTGNGGIRIGMLLVLAMALLLSACGSGGGTTVAVSGDSVTVDNLALRPGGEAGQLYENNGLKLMIPLEYDTLLQTDVPEGSEDGVLFRVTEKASVEAAKAQGTDAEGPGWLFSIGKVDEGTMQNMLLYTDLSGSEIFAVDAYGDYYVYYHPTDVRYFRADNEAMAADQEIWTELNEWAWGKVRASFLAENPQLMEHPVDASSVNLYMARIAYMPGVRYSLSTTEYGPVEPKAGEFDAAYFVERMMNGVHYEYTDEEAPDGEYVVLSFPEDGVRFDFFRMEGKENYVREVHEEGDYEALYRAAFDDGETKASEVMQEWYYAAVGAAPDGTAAGGKTATGMLGGWAPTDAPRMSEEAGAAFEKAMDGFVGVNYEPLACLATQLVSGTNYAVFCRAQVVYPNAQPYYALVYVYENLQGNAEIRNIVSLTPGGEVNENAGAAEVLMGGWSAVEDQDAGLAAFEKAAEGLLGVNYTPVTVLGSQVVSGTNYCVLCRAEAVAPGAEPYYTLATVYEDLSGNARITEFRDLDIAALSEGAASQTMTAE